MESIYIDRSDTSLEIESGRLLIRHADLPRAASVPLAQVKWVVISARTSMSSTVLNAFTRAGICLVSINPRRSWPPMISLPFSHGAGARRYRQYQWLHDGRGVLRAAISLVRLKVLLQRKTLVVLRRRRPDQRYPLTRGIGQINRVLNRLRRDALGADELMGMEGAAARAYFEALALVFAPSLGFVGRNRRPPRDPVNAALSLGYTLLHAEAVRALAAAGLDPMLGFYHALDYGRESLACDLVETERARLDLLVCELFASQHLRATHFSMTEGACLLGKAGRSVFYEGYEEWAKGLRSRLRARVQQWVRLLESETLALSSGSMAYGASSLPGEGL